MITTDSLSVGYRKHNTLKVLVSDVNISLKKGQFIGIIGSNGVGKSTLLRTLSNRFPALHGDIFFKEKEIKSFQPLEFARLVSIVLTKATFSQYLTVQELVALGRQPHTNWIGQLSPLDVRKITKAIEIAQIESLLTKRCYALSDGQLQKALIARSIAQDTPIIILDEPTTHLDLYYKAYILNMLKRLAFESQKLIIMATHEINFAIQLCDKILVIQPNQYEFGRPKQLAQCQAFSKLFPTDLIVFDENSQSFELRK